MMTVPTTARDQIFSTNSSETDRVKFYDLRDAKLAYGTPKMNEYKQFGIVGFVSRPAARGTGM